MRRLLRRLNPTDVAATDSSDRLAAGMQPPPRPLQYLDTLPGRLFVLSGALVVILFLLRLVVALPEVVTIFRRVVSLAFIVSTIWLIVLGFKHNRHVFLWRVRRKLILSYVFLGLVPVVLVVAFALVGGVLLHTNVAAYLFNEGFRDFQDDVRQAAETTVAEISRDPRLIDAVIERKYDNLAGQYPQLSLAVLSLEGTPAPAANGGRKAEPVVSAGSWRHLPVPQEMPTWMAQTRSFTGVLAARQPDQADDFLVIRAALLTPRGSHLVVADLPIDTDLVARLDEETGARIGAMTVPPACSGVERSAPDVARNNVLALFRESVFFMDCSNWTTGNNARVSIQLHAPFGRLYGQLAQAQSAQIASALNASGDVVLLLLSVLGVLFLIIQGSALIMGGMLARSITYAVHELFTGTERVQQGDFTHRINIESRDQLGDLAGSFNRMSASIEHLLHVQREKQRLDDELRIAREIQKSLLPDEPPRMAGLSIADLCEPAREVGGDYYDFFELGPRQLGVLIADVSGKGTSAALYMAELKGLMLALSHTERSPRRLLITVNRLLAAHLDNRSFITMTYAIVDLDAATLTLARAGHTPTMVVSGGEHIVVVPDGMVLGLRLPGASERFEQLLCEHSQPLCAGDVILFYTDGITEAMDRDGELFGDEALARVVVSHHHLDAAGIRERVLREVKAFVGDAEPHDDMTMIVLKVDHRLGSGQDGGAAGEVMSA